MISRTDKIVLIEDLWGVLDFVSVREDGEKRGELEKIYDRFCEQAISDFGDMLCDDGGILYEIGRKYTEELICYIKNVSGEDSVPEEFVSGYTLKTFVLVEDVLNNIYVLIHNIKTNDFVDTKSSGANLINLVTYGYMLTLERLSKKISEISFELGQHYIWDCMEIKQDEI